MHATSPVTFLALLHSSSPPLRKPQPPLLGWIEEKKQAALRQLENPQSSVDLSELLKSFKRRMDASGLLKFVVSKRKESVLLWAEILLVVMEEAVDPTALELEVVEEPVREKAGRTGIANKRWKGIHPVRNGEIGG
ncbi:hypothetical protein Tsubulata_016440 [Turnera subulata]|uniref:FRIGIDA-like protein n=1 Tax=Turnera subulata TaxID=218843 RepID=A0A9Q0F377_9ROSI|nr:hypothetical protein Tsubulata_016440 [Turnera subulata]